MDITRPNEENRRHANGSLATRRNGSSPLFPKALVVVLAALSVAAPKSGILAQPGQREGAMMGVGALGRLQPKDGVRRIAGPSEVVLVLSELLVDVGDKVVTGQVIARLDDFATQQANVTALEARLASQKANVVRTKIASANARLELSRVEELYKDGISTSVDRDKALLELDLAEADKKRAEAEEEVIRANLKQAQVALERRTIRSPFDGQVLKVHVREGEKVGSEGIVELGKTGEMYAVAEVYETDISKIQIGQRATVSSPVLPVELEGSVDRIAMKVGRKSIFDDRPTSRRDARVVEVEIRLDDSKTAARFTNLQVEVRFVP